MRAPCIHSNYGLCESCFKYERRIAILEGVLREIAFDNYSVYVMKEVAKDILEHDTPLTSHKEKGGK